MLWLDTSWVLDLTCIFRHHLSLFIVIFSTLTSSHHFFSGITYHHLWYSFSIFSLIIAYLTLSLFHLEWWFFTRHCMEDCHFLSSPHSPIIPSWGPYSVCMLWLDKSWLLDPSSHITTCDIRSLSFLSSLLTRHYPCFTLSGGFSHVTSWRIVTFFPSVHPMGSGSEISV